MSEEIKIPEELEDKKESSTDHSGQPEGNSSPKSDEIKSSPDAAAQLQTPNAQLQGSKMEVHHPHHLTHKKKWNEYLLEFSMLFLAVFLGFVAENIRENYVERHREKQFLESYKNDLLQNNVTYNRFDSIFSHLLPVYDSITFIYHQKRENEDLQTLARLLSMGKRTLTIPFNTTTYLQMVNSGNMRLIENKTISIGISKYNDQINSFKEFDLKLSSVRGNIYPEVLKIEDIHDFFHFDINTKKGLRGYIPLMDSFPPLKDEQRRTLVSYYRLYVSQTLAQLTSLRALMQTNNELLDMINKN